MMSFSFLLTGGNTFRLSAENSDITFLDQHSRQSSNDSRRLHYAVA